MATWRNIKQPSCQSSSLIGRMSSTWATVSWESASWPCPSAFNRSQIRLYEHSKIQLQARSVKPVHKNAGVWAVGHRNFVHLSQCGVLLGVLLLLASAWLTGVACELLMKSAVTSKKRSYEYLGERSRKTASCSFCSLCSPSCLRYTEQNKMK